MLLFDAVDMSWQADAVCKGTDPSLFFSDDVRDVSRVRALCRTCPVKVSCLEHAVEHCEDGNWGGSTEDERRRMRRTRRLSAPVTIRV